MRLSPLFVAPFFALVACGTPAPAPVPPANPAPSTAGGVAAPSAPTVAAPNAPNSQKIGVVLTIPETQGVVMDHGRTSSLLRRGADGRVQFAHAFLRATGPKAGDADFSTDIHVAGGPYTLDYLLGPAINSEAFFWNDPFGAKPTMTHWDNVERVGEFASIYELAGNAWTKKSGESGYLDVVDRAGAALTIEVFTPNEARRCSPLEDRGCKVGRPKSATFVGRNAAAVAALPEMPKGFCPDGLAANARGDLYVSGATCEDGTPVVAYYPPGATKGTVTPVEGLDGWSKLLALSPDGTLAIGAQSDLFLVTKGHASRVTPPAADATVARSASIYEAVGFASDGTLWGALRTTGTEHGRVSVVRRSFGGTVSSEWTAIPGPWDDSRLECTVLAFELSDAKDPVFLGENCVSPPSDKEDALWGSVDLLRKTARPSPQVLPGVRAQVVSYEAARPRTTVIDAQKCPETFATVVVPADQAATATTLLAKAPKTKTDGLAIGPARLAGKEEIVVQGPVYRHSAKEANAIQKLLARAGASLVCGIAMPVN